MKHMMSRLTVPALLAAAGDQGTLAMFNRPAGVHDRTISGTEPLALIVLTHFTRCGPT